MKIEFQYRDIDLTISEIKSNLEAVQKYSMESILVDVNHLRLAKEINHNKRINTWIDYPLGLSDIKTRKIILESVIGGHKIDIISMVLPFYYLVNRKYEKIREDIRQNVEICTPAGIELRYVLEYRKFDHQFLAKVCEILMQNNISIIYPSTGFFIDDIHDNIIASTFLHKKTGIDCIINGRVWTEKQADALWGSEVYGISADTILGIEILHRNR